MTRWPTFAITLVFLASLITRGGSIEAESASFEPPWLSLRGKGKCDAKVVVDATMTSGLEALTSATANFTVADVGKTVSIAGAGAGGATLVTTISGFTNATTVSTAATASTPVRGAKVYWGTDDSMALQAALTTVKTTGVGTTVYEPRGVCLSTKSLNIYERTTLLGEGRVTSQLVFTNTGDGIKSTWPINSSTAVWIRVAHLALINTNSANTVAEPAFITQYGNDLQTRFGQQFTSSTTTTSPQIGAATGVEFLPGGRLEAAAEPVRRGGGDAEVVHPSG